MGRYLKTRCFVGGKPAELRVRKLGDGYTSQIKRVVRAAPLRATHVALRIRGEWRIYATRRWEPIVQHSRSAVVEVDPVLVHTMPTVEAAEMWLMYRGSYDG